MSALASSDSWSEGEKQVIGSVEDWVTNHYYDSEVICARLASLVSFCKIA